MNNGPLSQQAIAFTTFRSARDNTPVTETLSLEALGDALTTPSVAPISAAGFFALDAEARREWKSTHLAAFSPATFKAGATRGNANVEAVGCVVIDVDESSEDIAAIVARMSAHGWAGVVYTSVQDRGPGTSPRRFRVVLFTERAMTPDEAKVARPYCAARLRIPVDEAATAAANLYFLPVRLDGGTFEAVRSEGLPQRVEELLARAQQYADARAAKSKATPRPDTGAAERSVTVPDEEIVALLKTRNKRGKITRLWSGDARDYNGDESSADLALASEIAYYTADPAQLERVFGLSTRANRDKWKDRADYRERTITKALADGGGGYWHEERSARVLSEDRAASLVGGREGLTFTTKGRIESNIHNAVQVLLRDRRVQASVGFNEFSGVVEARRSLQEVLGQSASPEAGPLQPADVTAVRLWLISRWGITLSHSDVYDAVGVWARHAAFNPVRARLEEFAAAWDGVPRLDKWLETYLGVEANTGEDAEYVREIGRRWLISAVARAYRPGCKVDHVLVLEGPQGAGKSRAARTLAEAVCAGVFLDSLPVLADKQEAARALRGRWIAELAELTSFRRTDTEQIKAFITTQIDNVRDPYERMYVDRPRTCVFIGTTNQQEWSTDDTGGRRFWPVRVGKIDTDALGADAPQLWGEAVRAFHSGEAWHLTKALARARDVQRDRQMSDVWDDRLHELVAELEAVPPISLAELWVLAFKGEAKDMTPQDQARFSKALRRAGFESRKSMGRMRWMVSDEKRKALHAGRPRLAVAGRGVREG